MASADVTTVHANTHLTSLTRTTRSSPGIPTRLSFLQLHPMSNLQQAVRHHEQLKAEFASSNPDLKKCGNLLANLKIELTLLGVFIPEAGKTDTQALLLARDILEIGAFWSLRVKDITSFERYIAQLSTFYHDYSAEMPLSQQMYPLTGLNLLRLLSQNRLSEFHTALEVIDPEQLHNNPYIKQAVDLEQYLMEGSYNKVWNSRGKVSSDEFLFFYDILIGTIRNEIASCSEKAYDALPLQDAATLLFFKSLEEVLNFAKERGWNVNPSEQKIYFATANEDIKTEIPSEKIIKQTLNYARELERIV